ncbi:MAG: hypothetical protein RSG56_11275, partial [Brevundimonas sp.]
AELTAMVPRTLGREARKLGYFLPRAIALFILSLIPVVNIVAAPLWPLTRIMLAVACTHEAVERLPEAAAWTWEGISIPQLRLDPRPASAGQVVASALAAL